jgi:16S rRNA C967 or C1407 C5-methylase (RsmB/RsmF family)
MTSRKGYAAFLQYYRQAFGADRWNSLLPALQRPRNHVAVALSPTQTYHMDGASLLPCVALLGDLYQCSDARRIVRIADLCAAPGGKSVVLAQLLRHAVAKGWIDSFDHVASDISAQRTQRLHTVLSQIPAVAGSSSIRVIHADASNPSELLKEVAPHSMDYILVDAPCSSERHLLHDEEEMAVWGPARPAKNAQRQVSILLSAARLLRAGGRIVYSTCALTPRENDDVVQEFVAKMKRNAVRYGFESVFRLDAPVAVRNDLSFLEKNRWTSAAIGGVDVWKETNAEKTQYGWLVLPDHNGRAWGPMYVAVLELPAPRNTSGGSHST